MKPIHEMGNGPERTNLGHLVAMPLVVYKRGCQAAVPVCRGTKRQEYGYYRTWQAPKTFASNGSVFRWNIVDATKYLKDPNPHNIRSIYVSHNFN